MMENEQTTTDGDGESYHRNLSDEEFTHLSRTYHEFILLGASRQALDMCPFTTDTANITVVKGDDCGSSEQVELERIRCQVFASDSEIEVKNQRERGEGCTAAGAVKVSRLDENKRSSSFER